MSANQKKLSPLDEALACQQKGDLDGAEAAFRAVLETDPDHPDALVLLGALLQKTRRAKEGVELIERAIEVAPMRNRAPEPAWRVALSFAKRDAGDKEGALSEIENLIRISPKHPELLFMKADLLRAVSRHEAAIETLKTLLEIKPQHEKAWNNLGISLRARGRKTEAFHAFLKVIELQPDHSQAANNAGQILSELDDPVGIIKRLQLRSEPAFDDGNARLALIDVLLVAGFSDQAESIALKALKRHPGNPALAVKLANIYAINGKSEKAVLEARQALSANPGLPGALAVLAEFADSGDAAALLEDIEAIDFRNQQLPIAISLNFSAGRLAEKLGHYERAFKYFHAANQGRRELVGRRGWHYDRSRMEAEITELIDAFPESVFAQTGADDSDLPVFIVGMPRSGTTLIEQVLASHPSVAGAGELNAIGNSVNWLRHEHGYPRSLDRGVLAKVAAGYLDRLRKVDSQASRVTDKMPSNFMHLGIIALLFAKTRIIHCRRAAIDCCWSCFKQNFGAENLSWTCDLEDIGHYYCQYRRLMNHWSAVLPSGSVLEIEYEETVADLEGQARKLIAFCGLEWDDACLRFYEASRAVRTASRNQVRKGIHSESIDGWRRYEDHVGPLVSYLNCHECVSS